MNAKHQFLRRLDEFYSGMDNNSDALVSGTGDHSYTPVRNTTVLKVVASAWITFGKTSRLVEELFKYISMKMGVSSRHGLLLRAKRLTSTVVIFATPTNPYYSGDLTPK